METQFPMKQILNEEGVVVNSEYENEMTEELTKELYIKMLQSPYV